MKMKVYDVKRLTQPALLFAVAVVLMALESAMPPIPTLPPGVKLGLSNIVVMYCLLSLDKKQAFIILLLKSGFVLITRGFIAFLLSFSGGIFSIIIMILLFQLKKIELSYIIISVCASCAHNLAQLLISSLLLESTAVFYYSPILLISGVVMGIVTGIILRVTIPAIKRLNRH